jgi:dTDP-4-dehydrorhamnose 3,5-epimerase
VIFRPAPLAGVFVLELERHEDERGSFARTYDRETFLAHGLDPSVAQCSVSTNRRRGTLRGLHWQAEPSGEHKLVRVTRGAAWDVVVDLRAGSPTRGRHFSIELVAGGATELFVPPGFAHGFLTLTDDTEVAYQISTPYSPEHARGVRWDDPTLAIPWPAPLVVLSDRDRALPYWAEAVGA